MRTSMQHPYRPDHLIDILIERGDLRNDRELAEVLEIEPSNISHIRHRRRPITAEILLRMHEVYGLSISKLRELAGMDGWRKKNTQV